MEMLHYFHNLLRKMKGQRDSCCKERNHDNTRRPYPKWAWRHKQLQSCETSSRTPFPDEDFQCLKCLELHKPVNQHIIHKASIVLIGTSFVGIATCNNTYCNEQI